MLSLLNAFIVFAALFALLSLIVTTTIQLLRTALGFGSRRLASTLLRLFGEIKEPERFVAAILSHSSLIGLEGHGHYKQLVDPATDEKKAHALAREVLEAHHNFRSRLKFGKKWGTWPTADLDKQTV